jgi:hypothetical protein
MEEKDKALSPSAKAFLALMSKIKEKTPLEIMREFNEKINQKKTGKDNEIGRETNLPDGGTGNKTDAPIKNPDEFKEALVYLKAKEYVRKLKEQGKSKPGDC